MTAEELRNRHMRTLFDKEQRKSPSLGGVIVMCKTLKKLQSSETSEARFRAGAVGGCLVSRQKAKVDASICLIPGRLSLDSLEFRATIDLE